MKLEEIKNVINEAPMPLEMLKKQMQQEKLEKDKQDRLEKDKQERLEKEKFEREKLEKEREKMERDKYERDRERERERIINYKNIINLPSHRDLSPTPLNRNMISPSNINNQINNVTPKLNQKIEFPSIPSNNKNNICPPSNQKKEYALSPSPANNNIFNPFAKNDIKFVEVKPILYTPSSQLTPKPNPNQADQFIKREVAQFVGAKLPNVFENKTPRSTPNIEGRKGAEPEINVNNKVPLKYPETEREKYEHRLDNKFIRPPETDRYDNRDQKGNKFLPVISPRNMDFLYQPKERPVIKRYLTPMNNQRDKEINNSYLPDFDRDIRLKKIMEKERITRDENKGKERIRMEVQREEERKQMKMSINLKRVYLY